ncbi:MULTISPECIES: lipid asymmetry maintenance protein MlaB [Mannheimia]|uniref:STAS domain-containing protein n=1 Tax=Mannheimia pernigra TaxID=111844 RepID=A0A7H8UNZ4_9PAST|nr:MULTISPECIES: STAS domain-containing protein [Mannheimia]QLB40209.1 STAS domain-containing protein [Mannheimia pernigra]QLB42203.1 STAS domain-containing protein [Mannheimia pernigra]QLB44088.1 STAS domain-containing protein [Mannheimia pernigra]QTM00567.1 STAS domain-containing protein [Mannheimia sp. ZY171111]
MPQKKLQWDVQQNNESLFVKLSGELTRDTLLPLWEQRASFLSPKTTQRLYWDLKEITRVDSAGFTLLAELLNHYHKIIPNSLIHTPDSVRTLAELYDLNDWFEQFII